MTQFPETGNQTTDSSQGRPAVFATTHWSDVLAAARAETTHAREALTGGLTEAPDPRATWAQAQFSRLDPGDPGNIFELKVRERPTPGRAVRIHTPTCEAIGSLAAEAPEAQDLLGTWELVGTKAAEATAFTPVPKEQRQIKLITPHRFLWVQYDPTSGEVQAEAGGPFSFSGEVCTERTEFAKEGTARHPGDSAEYQARLEGSNCYLSANNGDLGRVEKWQRVVGVVPAAEASVRKHLVGAWEMTEWRPLGCPELFQDAPRAAAREVLHYDLVRLAGV